MDRLVLLMATTFQSARHLDVNRETRLIVHGNDTTAIQVRFWIMIRFNMGAGQAKYRRFKRTGISRRDVLAIVLVVGLGGLFLFTYLFDSRLGARRRYCEFRQMSLGRALLRYESHFGYFPAYRGSLNPLAEDAPVVGWGYFILPYVGVDYDSNNLQYDPKQDTRLGPWEEIHQQYGPTASREKQSQISQVYIPQLVCPGDVPPHLTKDVPPVAWSSYVVNGGLPDASLPNAVDSPFPPDWPANGMFLSGDLPPGHEFAFRVTVEMLKQADGAANTLMLSENLDSGLWTDAKEAQVTFLWVPNVRDSQADPDGELLRINQRAGQGQGTGKVLFARPSSTHRGGVNVLYADGHTEFLSDQLDYAIYTYKMTSDGRRLRLPGSDQPIGPPYQIPDTMPADP